MKNRQGTDFLKICVAVFVIFLLKMLFDLIMEKLQIKKPKTEGPLCIFTDGSACKKNSGYGIFAGPGSAHNRSVRLMEGSHEDGELQAVIQTIKEILENPAERERRVVVFTDCLFILMGLREVEKGNRKGKTSSKKKSQHRNALQPLHTQHPEDETFIQKFRRFWAKYENHLKVIENLSSRCLLGVIFVHVPAHHGIYHNEVADILAKMAVFAPKRGKFEINRLRAISSSNKSQIKKEPIGERKLDYVFVKKHSSGGEEMMQFPGIRVILEPDMEVIWKPGSRKLPEGAILKLLKGKERKLPRIKDFIERMERKESIWCKEVFGVD